MYAHACERISHSHDDGGLPLSKRGLSFNGYWWGTAAGMTNEMGAVRRAVLSPAIIQTGVMLHPGDGCGYRSPKSLLFSMAAKGNLTEIVPTYSQ